MVSTRGMAAAASAAEEPAPALPRRRGGPPKVPAAEAPRSPLPVSPLAAAAASPADGYERERDARIQENMERMQKLGILDLSHRFNQSATAAAAARSGRGRWQRKPETPGFAGAPKAKPASPSPARRSLRLKSLDPVSYCEIRTAKEKDVESGSSDLIEEGSKEEVYTEEHEKLLGTCEAPWTLFVDGYGQDGKRIYDQVRGQTCHQCRQKTLGHHTSCCKCQIVQGQFCGDCLYMRYGENVLEAKKNLNWICPVCRGICNCSICRTKKGWFPTGCVYRKVVSLGYKSVAHYLIETRRSSAKSVDSSSVDSSNNLPSAKSEISSISEHALVVKQGLEDVEMSSKVNKNKGTDNQLKNLDGYMKNVGHGNPTKVSQNEGNNLASGKDETKTAEIQVRTADGCKDDSRSESVVTSDSLDYQVNQDIGCVTPSKPGPKKRKLIERSPDCVASRLLPGPTNHEHLIL